MSIHHRLPKFLIAAAVAACASFAAGPAPASIDLKFDSIGPSGGVTAPLHFNGSAVTARVGQLHFDAMDDTGEPPTPLTGDSLISFCIELGQHVSTSWKTYAKESVSDAPDPSVSPSTGFKIGDQRAAALDLLADNYWGLATGLDVVNAVAFQLAVWEIVHESPSGNDDPVPSDLNVSQDEGTFYVNTSPGGTLAAAVDQANSWLSGLGSLESNDSLSLLALTNPHKQDQIVQFVSGGGQSEPLLPEPTALVVWSCLGACVGLATSRRSRS